MPSARLQADQAEGVVIVFIGGGDVVAIVNGAEAQRVRNVVFSGQRPGVLP